MERFKFVRREIVVSRKSGIVCGVSCGFVFVGLERFQSGARICGARRYSLFRYFVAYNILTSLLTSYQGVKELGTATRLAVGAASEWCHLPLYLPMDTVIPITNEMQMCLEIIV